MSWDVMVFDFGPDPKPMHEMTDDDRPRPMGTPFEVRSKIDGRLAGVDWSDPEWGIYGGNGFTFEFNLGSDEPVESLMVHVRGGGDAIAALLSFAVPNGWSLLDCSTSEWIDPANPSQEGWEGFQAFRDRVMKGPRATGDPT